MNDICFELSSSWQSDFDTNANKLQRIRHRQRLPPLFLRKLRGKVRENVGQVANAYRSKHMCALSRPASPSHLYPTPHRNLVTALRFPRKQAKCSGEHDRA
jgi:hypothetical protein